MNLTKRFTHIGKGNIPISDLIITVEFDGEFASLKTISTYHYHSGITTDITAHMSEHFEEQLDSMVDSINWDEEAADFEVTAKEEREGERDEMAYESKINI